MGAYQISGRACWLLVFTFFSYTLVFAPSFDVVPWIASKYDDKRFLEISLLGAVLSCYAVKGRRLEGYGYTPLFLLTVLLISSFLSQAPIYAFCETALFVGLFFFADYVKRSRVYFSNGVIYAIVCCVYLSAIIYMVAFYTGCIASVIEALPIRWPNPFFGFSSVRFFNQYQIWGLPLLAIPFISKAPAICRYKKLLTALLIGWWVLLFASGSKGALLAMVFALSMTLIVYRRESFGFVKVQTVGGIGGLFVYSLLFHLIPLLMSYETTGRTVFHSTEFARLALWGKAIDLTIDSPIFGVGPMHYAWYPNHIAAHPHNSLFQIAAEWGLPALLVVLWLFCYGTYCWLKRFNCQTVKEIKRTDKQIIMALFCSLMAGAAYSLVSGVIVMPLSQILGATIIGLMLGIYHHPSSEVKTQRDNRVQAGFQYNALLTRLFAGLTLIVLVWSVMPELLPRVTGQEEFLPRGQQAVGPRFWQAGGIPH